ncbi:MAG: thioredoxin domain-containing protein [Candidatus Nanoarchaeia archaeon]|nr:thioredoxin domain-containing protein [Candidatus Nanoarchaeia archaeon]MDD5357606.1 thioredoxin domain-containing protein [Candidatus Nanoarchaeia archaeon]MDD5588525.1 thioredoxin domain-containing protein [Candidatus Nanoarchaeia archaeon]
MEEEKKEHEHHEHEHHKKNNLTEKIRENPWILTTFVLGILAVILVGTTVLGGFTGNISADSAGTKIMDFYNTMGVKGLTLESVTEVSGLYQVNLIYDGDVIPVYMTKDGKNLIPGSAISPLEPTSSDTNTETEVPKSDKPKVELYVFTYCPYGLQMEKAILPAINLLNSKIDFRIRQIGAMHGEYEKIEAERQLCVEKEYPDKFLNYILAFAEDTAIGSCNGDATCLTPKLNALYVQLGIDASKINSCMTADGEKLYNAEVSNANTNDVSGSPTLMINGVVASASRSPEGIKGVICSAFNTVPSECSQTLSTEQASAGFGAGTGSGSSSASC